MSLRFGFPITSIEKQADGSLRVVGLATDETLDSQGDVLDYEGSKAAFGNWRGNVREAHDPKKPVGKALSVNFDDTAKAIEVEAFISAGAPETQQKLLDGVLRSFSVGGGQPTKVKMEKRGDQMVRRVLEWPMTELSVVDVGANPNANIALVKSDGVATAALAADAVTEETVNRFSKALLAEIEKAKKPKAEAVEQTKPAQGKYKETAPDALHEEAFAGGTGTGAVSQTGGKSPKDGVPAPKAVANSAAPKDPAAKDVEEQGAAAGTVQNSDEVEGTVSIPHSLPPDHSTAEEAEKEKTGTEPADQSIAPKPAAEDVEGTNSGKGDAGDSAAPKTAAESVEAEKAGTGKEPAAAEDKIEDAAEAGGSDTEKDMIDGKKKRSPKGTDASVPVTGKSAKAAEREILTKYFYGTKGATLEDAAALVKAAVELYGPEDSRADLLALAASALVKFVGADALEHIPDAAKPTPMPAGNQGAQATTKDDYAADGEEEPDGDELSPPADPPDRFVQTCKGHGVANCDKCSKDDGGMALDDGGMALDDGGMALATDPRFTKALMPFVMREFAREIAKKYVPADARGVFKVNDGDQMAEGIGKGLSVVTTGVSELASEVAVVKTETAEIAKALTEFKGLTAELKGMRESINALSKTAAVPTPLRTVPSVSLEKSSPSVADALEAMANGETDPELKAKLMQRIAIAKATGK